MPQTYLDVAAAIRRRIRAGEYTPDRPLPPERALGEAFGIHRATLRRALSLLETEGILRRSPGDRPYPVAPSSRVIEGTIGLYASESGDPYARSLIATGIAEVLRRRESRLCLLRSDDHAFRIGETFPPEFGSHAGFVLWPPLLPDVARLRELRRSVPVVVVDTPVGEFESDFVGFDDEGAGYEAARHLIDAGHRRLAFVGTLQAHTARCRHHGFLRLLSERGIPPVMGYEPLAYADHLPRPVVGAYLGQAPEDRPTAMLCENDETAALLMPHLAERGLRVPDDLALVGFGGSQPMLVNALGLTTMEQPYVEVGRRAAGLLLRRMESSGAAPYETVRLPMRLRVRPSSGVRSDAAY